MTDLFMNSGAEISDCGLYRYRLWRRWDKTKPRQVWIMLNPSIADAEEDDPTIRRLMKRARSGGFGGIWVVNLFAYRSTDPHGLTGVNDPIGPGNMREIMAVPSAVLCPEGGQIVCGWGAHASKSQVFVVTEYLACEMAMDLHCLDLTKDGQPVHPLYQPYKKQPCLWLNRERWLNQHND